MAVISFSNQGYLFFLLVIPLLILVHFVTLKATKTSALRFANFPAISRISGIEFFSKNLITLILSIVIVFLLVMSLSGATWHITTDASSHSFILAIDSSQSMSADDISPTRMEAAKEVAGNFVDNAPITTKIGLISFSGNALIEQDLTDSKNAVKSAIKNVLISEISGTDINEAVITSTNLLAKEESKAIVLLSDGQINVGAIGDAVRYANENNVLIHTIAIGTEEGGETEYGLSKLDEESLQALAYNTEGEFFRITEKEQLFESFDSILKITKRRVAVNLSVYLLIASIVLFFVEYVLISTRYRRLV